MKFVNAQSTTLTDNDTKLKIKTIAGTIEEGGLYSYLKNSTDKQAIKTSYVLNKESLLQFEIGAYDKTKTLVIDPLVWATYYGGIHTDEFYSICVDKKDNIYITGVTASTNFPTQLLSGAYNQSILPGSADIVILKFNSDGIRQWATYYGGSINEYGQSICIDSQNNIYITGETNSSDFPLQNLTGAYNQTANSGIIDTHEYDAFLLKFNDKGERQWASYYGGDKAEDGFSICADKQDNIYITGVTNSTNLPVQELVGAYWQDVNAGIFTVKFNMFGAMQWATYYGGNNFECGYNVSTDSKDNVYISGITDSPDFPTKQLPGAYNQTSIAGDFYIFLLKFNNQGVRQ